jgi:transcriptional regulator with XRE-family HTH domain
MFNQKKFKALLVMKGKTMQNIADLLGINQATLYRKINGNSDFYRREIQAICNYLKIEDPNEIFFAQEITQTQNY